MSYRTIIVIPTYNERENIAVLIPQIFEYLPNTRIFVVDDNSPDNTAEMVFSLQKQYPLVSLTSRSEKNGLGSAYIHSFNLLKKETDIDWVITMDADGSHHPKYIADFIKKFDEADLVIGSRYTKGGGIKDWEWHRYLLSFFGNLYVRTLLRLPIKDITAGYNCYKKSTLDELNFDLIRANGYAFQIDMKTHYSKQGKNIVEVPIIFTGRVGGESKISGSIILEGLKYPFRWLWKK